MSTQQIHRRHVGDTRTALSITCIQEDEAGVEQVVDLTGFTVEFKMVDFETGAVVVAQTAVGVTIDADPTTGKVDYDFQTAGVNTAGVFSAYFIAIKNGETEHFPAGKGELVVVVEAD